jgi:hypothetical protein
MLTSLILESLGVSLLLMLLGWVGDTIHASRHKSRRCINPR